MAAVTAQNCICFVLAGSLSHPRYDSTYLVESVEEIGDQRATRARCAQCVHQSKLPQVANEAVGCILREAERVSPEVPLKRDDRARSHTGEYHAQSGLSSCQSRVQESKTRHHDQHHGRGHDDVGLVSRVVPLVQVDDICGENTQSVQCVLAIFVTISRKSNCGTW